MPSTKRDWELPSGVEIRGESLRISFMYKGRRCRETLGIRITKSNIKFASRKREAILHEIGTGTFRYEEHFPDSKNARLFSGPVQERKTVDELLDDWLMIKKSSAQHSTYTGYKGKADRWISPTWGQYFVDELTRTQVEKWISHDLKDLANKTINELLIILRGIMKTAKADRLIDYNFMEDIDNRSIHFEPPDPFTRSELNRIIETSTHRTVELLTFKLACWTGLRLSEWMALAWEDVDLEAGTIKVSRAIVSGIYKIPKTRGSVRTVELLQPALDALHKLKALTFMQPPREVRVTQFDNKTVKTESLRFVLLATTTGNPFTSRQRFRESFLAGHLRKAGIRHRGPNQARHTYASQLLTAGMSREWIARQMGHSSTRTLETRYAEWITEDAPDMKAIANKLLGFDAEGSEGANQGQEGL